MIWITLAVSALTAGLRVFGAAKNNQSLNREGSNAIAEATTANATNVLKADAAYLAALTQNEQDQQSQQAQNEQIAQQQKQLQTVVIIGAAVLVVVVMIIVFIKRKK